MCFVLCLIRWFGVYLFDLIMLCLFGFSIVESCFWIWLVSSCLCCMFGCCWRLFTSAGCLFSLGCLACCSLFDLFLADLVSLLLVCLGRRAGCWVFGLGCEQGVVLWYAYDTVCYWCLGLLF